jgi:hypothetical protein
MKKPKNSVSLFQSAIDNWPEDEAYSLARNYQEDLAENYQTASGQERDERKEDLASSCRRMRERVFGSESDCAELVKRFDAELLKLLGFVP